MEIPRPEAHQRRPWENRRRSARTGRGSREVSAGVVPEEISLPSGDPLGLCVCPTQSLTPGHLGAGSQAPSGNQPLCSRDKGPLRGSWRRGQRAAEPVTPHSSFPGQRVTRAKAWCSQRPPPASQSGGGTGRPRGPCRRPSQPPSPGRHCPASTRGDRGGTAPLAGGSRHEANQGPGASGTSEAVPRLKTDKRREDSAGGGGGAMPHRPRGSRLRPSPARNPASSYFVHFARGY